jgi:hypothetical protein
MSQIHGPSLGSPAAIVDKDGRLQVDALMTGSGGYYYLDKSSYSMPIITYEHHEIHDGNHYHVRGDATIASSGGSLCFYIFTPNGSKWTHLMFEVYSDNLIDYKEEIGCNASGAALVTVYNNNRNSTNIFTGSLISSPLVVTNSGTIAATGFLGQAGNNPNTKGVTGDYGRENEIILKSGTGYIWTFKAGGNNTRFGWDAEWYLHTDKVKQF